MESKLESNIRHLYLYCKGHYVIEDRDKDLKKIISVITGVLPEHIEPYSILYWLTTEVYKQITNYDRFFGFISSFLPDNYYRHNGDNYDIMVEKCISVLALTSVDDIDIELGEPDRKVLPLMIEQRGF
jgi:hypothetical protein